MKPLIHEMNSILADWKKEYDFLSAINSEFSDRDGQLFFDDTPLFQQSSKLQLSSAEFDEYTVSFYFAGPLSLFLDFEWPEDCPPYISSVLFA